MIVALVLVVAIATASLLLVRKKQETEAVIKEQTNVEVEDATKSET